MADPAEQDHQNEEEVEARPEWLPDNFKSPEDLVASFKDAQRKITEETSARKALETNYADLAAQVEQLNQARPEADPNANNQWYEAFEADPISTITQLAKQMSESTLAEYQRQTQQPHQQTAATQHAIVAELAVKSVASKYDDYEDYKDQIAQKIQARPNLLTEADLASPQIAAESLEEIYKMVKADAIVSGKAAEIAQSNQARDMKLQAQSAQGAAGRPNPVDDAVKRWTEIQNAPSTSYSDLLK